MQTKTILLISAISGMMAVMIGAFGAHGLEKILSPDMLQRYHTGVEYHFYHSLALFCTGLAASQYSTEKFWRHAAIAFTCGIILFSGSLYLYAISGIKTFGMITPLGGTAFIIGWIMMAYAAWRT